MIYNNDQTGIIYLLVYNSNTGVMEVTELNLRLITHKKNEIYTFQHDQSQESVTRQAISTKGGFTVIILLNW